MEDEKFEMQTLEEYQQQMTRESFNADEAYQRFVDSANNRQEWDSNTALTIKIQKDEFPSDEKLNDGESFYFANTVKTNVEFRTNAALTADIDVNLTKEGGLLSPNEELLETMMNYIAHLEKIPYEIKQPLHSMYYHGEGIMHIAWDTSRVSRYFATGRPYVENIDARTFYRDPTTFDENKKDCRFIFVVKKMDTEELKAMVAKDDPEKAKKIQPGQIQITNSPTTSRMYTNEKMKTTEVLVYQFKKVYYLDMVTISNLIPDQQGNPGKSEQYLWSDYEDHLKSKGAIDPKLGQQYQENEVFPEGIVASEKQENIRHELVYEVIFIPDQNIIIQEPTVVGHHFTYVSMSYYHDPDSAYSFGIAKSELKILEASGILLTLQLYDVLKTHKSCPIVEPGSLLNETEFLAGWWIPGMHAMVNPKWRELNPNVEAVKFLIVPANTNAIAQLRADLERIIDRGMATPPSSKGISDSASDSGRGIYLKQQAASSGTRGDFEIIKHFLETIMDILKYYLCKYRTYPHETPSPMSQTGMAEVNTNPMNKISDIDDTSLITEVTLIDSTEGAKMAKEQKYLELYRLGLIPYEFLMYAMNIDNVEKAIQEKYADDAIRQYGLGVISNPKIKEFMDKGIQDGTIQVLSQEEAQKSMG